MKISKTDNLIIRCHKPSGDLIRANKEEIIVGFPKIDIYNIL